MSFALDHGVLGRRLPLDIVEVERLYGTFGIAKKAAAVIIPNHVRCDAKERNPERRCSPVFRRRSEYPEECFLNEIVNILRGDFGHEVAPKRGVVTRE